jgi:hypothetical protein
MRPARSTIRRARPGAAATALALAVATGGAAGARPASSGFYTEAGAGAEGFVGAAAADSQIGPTLALRLGWEPFAWFALGLHLEGSSHEATVPPPPTGEWFQIYRGQLDGRLTARTGAYALFAEGGVGAALISSNVLDKVGITEPGQRATLSLDAGCGVEYQLENRHYAFGVAADWWLLPQFDHAQGASGRLYLRYTY